MQKKGAKNSSAGDSGNPEPGGVNPLKQLKGNKRSDIPQTRPGVPSGTVADMYTYLKASPLPPAPSVTADRLTADPDVC